MSGFCCNPDSWGWTIEMINSRARPSQHCRPVPPTVDKLPIEKTGEALV